ncbi:Putative anti-sigma factor [hydrothermal vent metagenome]|uniref:Anti-sigma factor n=1 Tax=hydrothermal vent metagenome TaxID=652676 RepID=A0A3B0U0M9_9ZZZZ
MNTKTDIPKEIKASLVSYLSGQIADKDFNILNQWIQENAENKRLFDQVNDIWQATSSLNQKLNFDTNKAWDEISKQLDSPPSNIKPAGRIYSELIKIAAVFVFALFLGGMVFYFIDKNNYQPQTVEFVAPLGSRSFLKMPDGTKVWLNAGTKIQYRNDYGLDNRKITLAGEAFFNVAKNKKLPFIVQTSAISITALGTKFNVKAYAEENSIETTLIEGSVKLESLDARFQEPLVLSPNEKAVYTKSSRKMAVSGNNKDIGKIEKKPQSKPSLTLFKSVDTKPIISWKEKRWVISNQKLSELSVKLERRYDVNFIFENERLKDYAFGGTLEDETLGQVLEVISFAAPIKYVIDKRTVYIKEDVDRIKNFKDLLME